MYLGPELARDTILAKNIQQELAYTSLRTVTVAVEIRYNPVPTVTIIPEDEGFVADEDIEAKLHPRLHRLVLDRVKTIDPRFIMTYVAGRIAECFKPDLIVIWSEDNSERLVIRCRVLGGRHGRNRREYQLENNSVNQSSNFLESRTNSPTYSGYLVSYDLSNFGPL